ncbi:FimV/HubP family polar landmark protein [Hydrogenophaga sp.]|uniref:FimV/HubP family polar landmark protein n=1 Tax=Hydrogenophaga sp. TaxID=1904254 RepID=UPI0026128F0A|nr:FimV/HubP family polar landmark protein [Hydrogenophaga sp.]MCW5653246.1 fimbrial protein FimV [Hydrogenophaga sp.]
MRGLVRLHAVAAAAMLCAGFLQPTDAQALALGRVVVQSALGEPLRAEIDVPDINNEEASSLRVNLAPAEAFRAAGIDLNAALSTLQISLQRRADGRAYLRLTSARPITEPFVDLIVEANWASGRIVRDYTLLFDPPNLRAAQQPAPLAPGVSSTPPATTAQAPRPIPPVAQAPTPPATAPAPAPVARTAPAPAPTPAARTPAPAPAPSAGSGNQQVRVRAGDTAGAIAAANRPAQVSLDQMLVAMLRANPNAFIDGNVNRIKAGTVLDMPAAQEAAAVSPGEARQTIAAQSRDFNEFRRRLAGSAPAAGVAAADRQAAGRVQTEVQEAKPAAPSPDKLTLSKEATVTGQGSREDQIAKERQAQDLSNRRAELSRNIEELSKLGAGTPPAAAPAPAAPAAAAPATPAAVAPAPAAPAPAADAGTSVAPAVTIPTTPPPEASASAPVEAVAPAAPAAETAASAPSTTPSVATAPRPVPVPLPDEPTFLEQLRDNPLVLPLAGGLAVLLAALGFYRMRQRKHGANVDSSFLESRLQPDSFFGSSGGQRIDTAESVASGSSMVYSPSQLDAAGDVDPVAEADVYLAYGRDLQAEEILKEAMRSTPTRVAIHNKLLEIYAKRRDARAFEVVATEAYGLTQGQGPEWEHACEMGRELDPSNPLYQPGGAPAVKAAAAAGVIGAGANTMPFGSSTLAEATGAATPSGMGSLDLDLDFSLDEPSAPAPLDNKAAGGPALEDPVFSGMDDLQITEDLTRQPPVQDDAPSSMSMDFDLDFPSGPAPLSPSTDAAAASETTATSVRGSLGQEVPPLSMDLDAPVSAAAEPFSQPAVPELMSFNLNDINLELDNPAAQPAADDVTRSGRLTEENPLETKLSLAEEFRAIGDFEGARSLAEEVLAEASGTLKTKAGTFLADLA